MSDSIVANFETVADDYPFFREWEQAQREPVPTFGKPRKTGSLLPSPLAIDRLPERKHDKEHLKRNDTR